MSVQELKTELAALSETERAEVSAFLFHLRHASDLPRYPAAAPEFRERRAAAGSTVVEIPMPGML